MRPARRLTALASAATLALAMTPWNSLPVAATNVATDADSNSPALVTQEVRGLLVVAERLEAVVANLEGHERRVVELALVA